MDSIDTDEVIFNLKATIASSKGGVLLNSIQSDYYNINGTNLPYKELGYSSLKEFIRSFKVFKIDESRYDPIVTVVSDAKTQHLQEMIKKQKATKKPKYKKRPKVILKKFTADYHTSAKHPTFKRKVSVASNFHNYTAASSSTNTLNSKWLKNCELPSYKRNTAKVSNINNYTPAISSTNTLKSKLLKNDELPTHKINVGEVSNINNYTSAVSSTKTFYSNWPTNNEVKKNETINKNPSVLTKVTTPPSNTQKNENHIFENNKDIMCNKKPHCYHVSIMPKKTIKIMKPSGQSAQDRLQKFVKKDVSEIEIKDNVNVPMVSNNFNYLNRKTSELIESYVSVNEIIQDNVNVPMVSKELNYLNQKTSELCETRDDVNKTIKNSTNEPIVLQNFNFLNQNKSEPIKTYVNVNEMIKDFNNKHLISKNVNYVLKTSELIKTYDNVNETLPTNKSELLCNEINQLKIQSKCKMTATVTAIYNLSDIWVYLDETEKNESFWKLKKELKIEMDSNNLSPIKNDPSIGEFYALYHQQTWHRVVIECINSDESILCFFVDTGKSVHKNKNQIYPLKSKYFNIPGQAVNILLNKFNLFNDFPLIKDILIETLLDKKFLLIPNNVITTPPSVTLYELGTMMNVNDKIITKFFEKVTSTFPPTTEYKVTDAKVLSILDGYLYLQTNSDLVKSLENLLLTDIFSTGSLKNSRDLDYKNVYLTTYKSNIKGRVKVMHFIDDSRVKIFFIDYGVYRNVELNELININTIDILIARIPSQAVKTILHMFPPQDVTNETIDVFFKILGNNYNVSVMGLLNSNNNIPCVQLWNGEFPDKCLNLVLYTRMEKLKNNGERSRNII